MASESCAAKGKRGLPFGRLYEQWVLGANYSYSAMIPSTAGRYCAICWESVRSRRS
jgi:hypothetical protein